MLALLLLSATLLHAGDVSRSCPALEIAPSRIDAGAFYSGVPVRVQGTVTSGSQAIVTVTGSVHEERYNRKARFGPIWLGAGGVRISGAPSFFLRFSSMPVGTLLSREVITAQQLDETSVITALRIQPAERDAHAGAVTRANYLSLKKSTGAYSFGNRGIVMGDAAGGCAPFTLQFDWPKQAPPGTYAFRLYEIYDGAVLRSISAALPVVRTGFPAWLAGLAQTRAPLYGGAAVVIGALAGFGIDLLTTGLFGKKKRRVAH